MPQSSSFSAPEHWSPLAKRIYGKQYRRLAGVPMGVLSALNAAKTDQPGVLDSDVVGNLLDLVRFRSTEGQFASPVIEWPGEVLDTQRGAEDGVHATLMRLVLAWAAWGMYLGHFGNVQAATQFVCEAYADLFWQRAAPNSPQWYNAGLHTVYHINDSGAGGYGFSGGEVCEVKDAFSRPQTAACFILSVSDSLEGIMEWVSEEARVFKRGSGVGVNVSNLRALNELLSSGGRSSGLMSFLPIANTAAGAIKSGGTTRRAAKMVALDVDHPDVIEFIRWKPREEARAAMMVLGSHMFQALKPELGLPVLDTSWQGDAMASVGGQNSNNSLMAPDAFMRAVLADQPWALKARTSNDTKLIRAREIMDEAVDAIWKSADPGFQFYDTINRWHVTPSLGPIRASNPCVTGDTLVTTKNGLRRIDTLLDAPFEVMCGDGEFRQVAPAFATGVKPIFRIELKDGGVLRCTEDHLIRSAGVDVAARDLQPGQRVDLGAGSFGALNLPEGLGRLIGAAAGDGCISGNSFVLTLAPNAVGFAEALRTAVNALKPGGAPSEITSPQGTLRITSGSARVRSKLAEFATLDAGSLKKRFSDAVFQLDRASQAEVLQGLFSTDGTVASKVGWDKSRAYISLDSVSLELLAQTRQLLRNFGIATKLYARRPAEVRSLPDGQGGTKDYRCAPSHSLRIAGQSRFVFESQIGFYPESDKAKLLRELNATIAAYQSNTSYTKVVRVVAEPAEQVFDLTEPVTSHFVANGVVIHNCAEYVQVDNSACNLASINLVQWDALRAAERSKLVERWTTILDITVDMGQYPNEKVARNVQKLRNLGLGISNLGAYLLRQGLAYDSDEGRAQTQYAMFEILGDTMRTSQELARRLGAYPVFEENAEQHEAVFKLHLAHAPKHHPIQALTFAPFRNAQLTLAAPTGTIGLVMGCETTGVEPMFAFEATKSLADGSEEKLSITSVAEGLRFLGLKPDQIDEIVQHTAKFNVPPESASPAVHKLLETASGGLGRGTISVRAHLEMMAALQPALSGAISKTVNMPKSTTRQEIFDAIIMAWRLGLKSIAFYRDGSKLSQPLTTAENCDSGNPLKDVLNKFTIAQMRELLSQDVTKLKRRAWGERRKLPRLRPGGYTRQVSLDSQSIYMHMGEYEDGQIGEVFLQLGRSGSVSQAMLDSWAKAISIGLQYGVPPEEYVEAFLFTRCEPSGPVQGHEALKFANSPIDLVMREIAYRYCGRDDIVHVKPDEPEAKPLVAQYTPTPGEYTVQRFTGDICPACQSAKMIHNGTCKLCTSCGTTTGCS